MISSETLLIPYLVNATRCVKFEIYEQNQNCKRELKSKLIKDQQAETILNNKQKMEGKDGVTKNNFLSDCNALSLSILISSGMHMLRQVINVFKTSCNSDYNSG